MFTVMVPLGPGEREAGRLADLADALAAHEPGPWRLVIADDDPESRDAASLVPDLPAGCEVVAVRFDRRRGRNHLNRPDKDITPTVLSGLRRAHELGPGRFVLKMDSDALIIAPFADRLAAEFRPGVGLVGACRTSPDGTRRDFTPHADVVRQLARPPIRPGHLRDDLRRRFGRSLRPVRQIIRAARANGYAWGEHCLGGAYAVSPALLDALHDQRRLTPEDWLHVEISEDVALGLLCHAAGLEPRDSVRPNAGVFGVRYKGLPFDPPALLAKGYALAHSVKNHPGLSEDEARNYFRHRRASAAP